MSRALASFNGNLPRDLMHSAQALFVLAASILTRKETGKSEDNLSRKSNQA